MRRYAGAGYLWRVSSNTQRQKQKPRIAPGPLLSKVHPSLERMSVFAPAFRSSHVVGAGTSGALIRWSRGTTLAARARSCGHAFFVLLFLARGGAGTDGSFTGRAGRGLILSRRNERRTEQRRHDKGRDRKFGSHQKCLREFSRSLQDFSKPRQAIWFRCVAYIAQISFSKRLVCGRRATSVTFLTSVTFRTQDLRKAVSLIFLPSTHHKRRATSDRGMRNARREFKESSLPKMRRNDVIAGHRA
jgi:hypothetical protein